MVAEPLHLSKAPIVEAIIGIDFSALPPDVVARFPLVLEQLAQRYHQPKPLFETTVQFHARGAEPPKQDTLFGIGFASEDGYYQVQLRPTAFMFSRLAPYESWDVFTAEAKAVWAVFQGIAVTLSPVSLGLRYVNKVSFPADQPIERYLRLYPTVPDSLRGGNQFVNRCYIRVEMAVEDPEGLLIAQVALLPPEAEGLITFALDNDFRFGLVGAASEKLWELLDRARHQKNQYFVHFITPELLDTYR
jgi:uncharacterized protein (TIGR04255 family)